MSRQPLPANTVAFRPTRAKPSNGFLSGRPKCPKYLSGEARAEWQRVVRLLAERGTLTRADAPSLELYTMTYASWRRCQEEIQRDGPIAEVVVLDSSGAPHTVRKQSEASKLAAKLASQMRQLLKEFGSTPSSREKATPAKDGFKDKEPPKPGTAGWLIEQYDRQKLEEKKDGIRKRPGLSGTEQQEAAAAVEAGADRLNI